MNKVSNLIWSAAIEGWAVACEYRLGRDKLSSACRRELALLAAMTVSSTALAAELPTGGSIKLGSGSIDPVVNQQLNVQQSSSKLAIDWQSFDIGVGKQVNFQQPDSRAIALNRVVGTNGSQILGQLNANGRVFLINPNGVLFGSNARVNVGSLITSTLDVSVADFAAGNYHFQGNDKPTATTNQGMITADGGAVVLLGGQVSNQGIIQANLGSVTLAAAKVITLDFAGDGLLNVRLSTAASNALAQNSGLLRANGGQVQLAAQTSHSLLNTAVNNQGMIEAQSLHNQAGKIVLDGGSQGLVQVNGRLVSSSHDHAKGGDISIRGQNIQLNALLDSHSVNDAGQVQVQADQLLQLNAPINSTSFRGHGGSVVTTGQQVQIGSNTLVDTRGSETGNWQLVADQLNIDNLAQANTLARNLDITHLELHSRHGDLAVNSDINWHSANQLTLSAQNNVRLNANLIATGRGAAIAFNHGSNGDYVLAQDKKVTLSGQDARFSLNGEAYTVIHNINQLQAMENQLNGRYVLGNTIDASVATQWNQALGFRPVGNNTSAFSGVFSGLGNTINQLLVNQDNQGYAGLFGFTNGALLRNISLIEFSSQNTAGRASGSLVGWLQNGRVQVAYVNGAKLSGDVNVGGLIGYSEHSTITQSYASVEVNGRNTVGGLIGASDHSIVSQAHASGTVSGAYLLGGLIGYSDSSTLRDVYANANVSGTDRYSGGLIGSDSSSNIMRAYASGQVSGRSAVGGLIGATTSSTLSDVHASATVHGSGLLGGLIGQAYWSEIKHSHASGNISGGNTVGGLIGESDGSTMSDVYANGTVSANNYVGGLIGNALQSNITQAYSSGQVSGRSIVGGLIGYSENSNLNKVYANSAVSGNNGVGGLIGWASSVSSITQGYANGDVVSRDAGGALIGWASMDTNRTDAYGSGLVNGQDGDQVGQWNED
ncbi:filamentous hemagglutinin N-terminal domain-containing protein [Neisseriaceae bacterium TC5R-5]|nr:filamentous hemagglutinin N-terminal domain-containing protein [Neisseriaceae bacterium TC5R-5]